MTDTSSIFPQKRFMSITVNTEWVRSDTDLENNGSEKLIEGGADVNNEHIHLGHQM